MTVMSLLFIISFEISEDKIIFKQLYVMCLKKFLNLVIIQGVSELLSDILEHCSWNWSEHRTSIRLFETSLVIKIGKRQQQKYFWMTDKIG